MNKAYQAYSKASHTVPKTKQIVMLYDGIIRNLQQAREAMEKNDIEQRYNKLVKASEIIIGLQSCLDYDQGKDAAQVLYDFYSSLDSRIIGLHRTNNVDTCQQMIDEVKEIRTMWHNIDQGQVEENQSTVQGNDQNPEPAQTEAEAEALAEAMSPKQSDGDSANGSGVAVSA